MGRYALTSFLAAGLWSWPRGVPWSWSVGAGVRKSENTGRGGGIALE